MISTSLPKLPPRVRVPGEGKNNTPNYHLLLWAQIAWPEGIFQLTPSHRRLRDRQTAGHLRCTDSHRPAVQRNHQGRGSPASRAEALGGLGLHGSPITHRIMPWLAAVGGLQQDASCVTWHRMVVAAVACVCVGHFSASSTPVVVLYIFKIGCARNLNNGPSLSDFIDKMKSADTHASKIAQ